MDIFTLEQSRRSYRADFVLYILAVVTAGVWDHVFAGAGPGR